MEIPGYIIKILNKISEAGYEAHIVGGCVRDLLMGKQPQDWDITTNAKPEEILKIFPDGKYENLFGTVLLPVKAGSKEADCVEATTYRSEQGYSDRRHPDKVVFEDSLEKDLSRRDFTINALALKLKAKSEKLKVGDCEIIDLFGGQKDIKNKIIRAVGEPSDRFKEDALRMMRAVRLSCQLGFSLEPKTKRAIAKMAGSIKFIAKERIRDEIIKILKSERPYEGMTALYSEKLLQYIIPELERGVGVEQSRHHIYPVFMHLVLSLKNCPSRDWRVRLAALLHDIAKPVTKKTVNGVHTFYNHDWAGAKITLKIMKRLKFSGQDTAKVELLVKNHMFYYNVNEVTAASVRRLIAKVGAENLKDLIDLRIADRLGSGVPKAKPYKLRHLEYMMKKVRRDPVSVKMLEINGHDIMEALGAEPGPKIGAILDVLLSEVIEDAGKNSREKLLKRAEELNSLNLDELRQKAKKTIEEKKIEEDDLLKKEFWV